MLIEELDQRRVCNFGRITSMVVKHLAGEYSKIAATPESKTHG